MRRWSGFGRTLAFGATGALLLPLALALGSPLFGPGATLRGVVALLALAYLVTIAPRAARRGRALAVAGALALLLLWLPLSLAGTAIGAAGLVALCRSGLLFRHRPLRGLVVEGTLAGLGLGAAALLAQGNALALSLALWGYFLVQSAFFLIAGAAPRRAADPVDPFERARIQLLRLLEGERQAPD